MDWARGRNETKGRQLRSVIYLWGVFGWRGDGVRDVRDVDQITRVGKGTVERQHTVKAWAWACSDNVEEQSGDGQIRSGGLVRGAGGEAGR